MNELTTKQAANKLNVSTARVRRMVLDGAIEARKIGRDLFIPESEVTRIQKTERKPGRPPRATNGNDDVRMQTAFDIAPQIMKRLVGKHDSGISDLGSNKKHLEGFGRD